MVEVLLRTPRGQAVEEEPLGEVDAGAPQGRQVLGGLDPLGDHLRAGAVGELGQRGEQRLPHRVVPDPPHQIAVEPPRIACGVRFDPAAAGALW